MANIREIKSIWDWVESEMILGHYTFTRSDVVKAFASKSERNIQVELNRLVKRGELINVWRNFYVIVPVEFRYRGLVPVSFYIDALMKYLGTEYYVSLLNAAEYYGASHQVPMSFTVMTDCRTFRSGVRNGTRVKFVFRSNLPKYIRKFKTNMGTINVSTPEQTAVDLLNFEHISGGLGIVASVLMELSENVHFDSLDDDFFRENPLSAFQRLGYILDEVIEEKELADVLYSRLRSLRLYMKKVPLKTGKSFDGLAAETRWRIYVNETPELEDI